MRILPTEQDRLSQIMNGPITPMRRPVYRRAVAPVTPRGSWWSALTKLRIFP